MKYLIVSGSARPHSQAIRIAAWIEKHFEAADETVVLDLSEAFVPFDTSALWDKESQATKDFAPSKQYLEWCDALVVVSPEWHGMMPGKLLSFLQAAAEGLVVAHKPGLIIGESSTRGGAFPEAMIRGFSSKNSRITWIPEHLLVRNNGDMFKDNPEIDDDRYIQARAKYCIELLRSYTEILAPGRERLLRGIDDYRNGM